MKRREFFQSTAAAAAATVLPAAAACRHGAGRRQGPAARRRGHPGSNRNSPHRRSARGQPARPRGRQAANGAPIRLMTKTTTGPRPSASGQLLLPGRRHRRSGHGVRVPDGDRQSEHVLLLVGAEAALPHPAQAGWSARTGLSMHREPPPGGCRRLICVLRICPPCQMRKNVKPHRSKREWAARRSSQRERHSWTTAGVMNFWISTSRRAPHCTKAPWPAMRPDCRQSWGNSAQPSTSPGMLRANCLQAMGLT